MSKDILANLADLINIMGVQAVVTLDGKTSLHLPMDVFYKTFEKEDCEIHKSKSDVCDLVYLHIKAEYKGFTFCTQGVEREWKALLGED